MGISSASHSCFSERSDGDEIPRSIWLGKPMERLDRFANSFRDLRRTLRRWRSFWPIPSVHVATSPSRRRSPLSCGSSPSTGRALLYVIEFLAYDIMLGSTSEIHGKATSSANVRSEEHTSELTSLMRISYDVFCLKK